MSKLTEDIFINGRWLQRHNIGDKYTWTVSGVLWNNVKERCKPGSATQQREPTYIGSQNLFEDFNSFVEWNRNQKGYARGYDLDSDILKPNSKVYSENTCLLVPPALNRFLQSHTTGEFNERGLSPNGNGIVASCSINCDKTGKKVFLLHKYFNMNKIEEAKLAYASARTEAGNIWYNRLLSGDYEVDDRVIDFMKNWRFSYD